MDDLLRFSCAVCGKRLKAPVIHAGRRARCSCGEMVQIPETHADIPVTVEPLVHPQPLGREPSPTFARLPAHPTKEQRWTNPPIATTNASPTTIPTLTPPAFSVEWRYASSVPSLWTAICDYLTRLPALTVIHRDDQQYHIAYRSPSGAMARLNLSATASGNESIVKIEEFIPSGITRAPMLTAALKTAVLDQQFKQTGGPGGKGSLRVAGLWKMGFGGVIGLVGVVLTAATGGEVLFYGAIVTGLLMILAGAFQAVFGLSAE